MLLALTTALRNSPTTPHRLIVPSLLSPLVYPASASNPHSLLPFLHSIRALLSIYPLTVFTTLPLPLSPRSSGLTRWVEHLHDGAIELSPFPHSAGGLVSTSSSKSKEDAVEEPPQGLLKIHRLPLLADRGVGTRAVEDDWAFTLSRRRLALKEWRLGPIEDEPVGEASDERPGSTDSGQAKGKKGKEAMEF
jgi:elongator complex protein 4